MSSRGTGALAKARALAHLSRLRDTSRDIFRNLHLTARTGKEETERADMLAINRERLLAAIHQTQLELNKSVEELKQNTAHKERMNALHKEIEVREAALRQYGLGLQKVENILSDGLRAVTNPVYIGGGGRGAVEVEVDEVVRYAHLISYTTSAKEGWEANTPLIGALPPMPHIGLLSRSRLFESNKHRMEGEEHSIQSLFDSAKEAGSKRPADDLYVRVWNPPTVDVTGESQGEADADTRPAKKHAGSNHDEEAGGGTAAKRPFSIKQISVCVDEKDLKAGGGNADADFFRTTLVIPQKPAKWRPGDPIIVGHER